MAYPVTLSDIDFVHPQPNPFKVGGSFYIVARDASTTTAIKVLKADSDDPSGTWAEQDAANRPDDTTSGNTLFSSLHAIADGSTIHIISHVHGTVAGYARYHTFDTSTNTWSIKDEIIISAANVGGVASVCAIGVRSDGDVLVVYSGISEKIMGVDYDRVYLARREGGVWTVNIDPTSIGKTEVHLRTPFAIMADQTNDRFHVFWTNETDLEIAYATYLSDNTFGHQNTLIDASVATVADQRNALDAVSFDDGGTKIRLLYEDIDGSLNTAGFADADSPGAPTITDGINDSGNVDSAALALDGITQHALFQHSGDTTIIRHDQTGAGDDAWGTDEDELDSASAVVVYAAEVWDNVGATELAYLYTEGGVEKINARVLALAPAATAFSGTGTFSTTGALAFQPETAAFRFYDDDGAEDASTPLDSQDTDVTVDISGGDAAVQFRALVRETGGGGGAASDDWQLEVSKNSGAFANVDAGSSNVSGPAIIGWNIGAIGATEANSGALTEEATPNAMAFKPDGLKVYIIGTTDDTIYQYPLSVAWDVSTIGAVEANSGVLTEDANPRAIVFKPDGLTVYVIGSTNRTIYQYPLSIAWDISSIGATDGNSGSLASEEATPLGMAFKADGTKVYIIGLNTDTIFQYPLSTAWDISSIGATEANSGILTDDDVPSEIIFKPDGTKVYVSGNGTDTIYQYALSTPWEIDTIGTSEANSGTIAEEGSPQAIAFKPDGLKFYVIGTSNDTIYQYPVEESASALTDGAATTNRATNGISDPGAGVFVVGVQEANDGLIANHQLTGGDFTEHVWGLTLIAADLADADTLDFRLLLNGSPITATVTPRITVAAGTIAATTAFSGTATLVTTATLKIPSTTAFAASGSLSTIPSVKVIGETAFTASGALTTDARLLGTTAAASTGTVSTAARLLGTTAFAAAGSAASTATLKVPVSTAFTGTGTAATAARLTGATAFTASGALASTATVTLQRTTASAGTGTLSTTARLTATTAFSASGTLTTTAGEIAQRTTAFAGAGSATITARLLGTTALSASGTLSTAATLTVPSTTAYSAAGTASSAARFIATTAASASGALSTTATLTLSATTSFAAQGALAASARIAASTAFSGVGAKASTARLLGTTAFNGAGLLATTGTLSGNELSRTTAFSAAGILSTAATQSIPVTTAATGAGAMATAARLVSDTTYAATGAMASGGAFAASTAASASGVLSTAATLTIPRVTAANAVGAMTSAARLVEVTVFSASGALTTTATLTGGALERSTAFSGFGTLSTEATLTVAASTEFAGAGLLSAAARQVATTAYAAIGTATTAARLKGATALTAAGTFSSAATLTIQAATDYTATATVTMIGTIVTTPDVEIPGVWDGCEHDGDWQAPSIAGRFR